jgi:hypothetical protein
MYHRGLKILKNLSSEKGSISTLVIGLFLVLLLLILILTDISSIYLAKRSLTLATEAAVQRAMQNLDAEEYYSGEYNLTRLFANSLSDGEEDPGIPIDCNQGERDADDLILTWSTLGNSISRANLSNLKITNFQCDGYQIFMETGGVARLPIPIPFIDFDHVEIESHAGAVGERAETDNFYGLDIG